MEKSFVCWSPLAAPAVVRGADGELQEPSPAADGPQQSCGSQGCGGTLCFSGFLGLGRKPENLPFGRRQRGRSAAMASVACAALSISSAVGMGIPSMVHLCQSLTGGLIHGAL